MVLTYVLNISSSREALNLSESPPTITIKRERELNPNTDELQPPAKRTTPSLPTPTQQSSHFHMPTPANSNSFSEDREDDEEDVDCDKRSAGVRLTDSNVSPRHHHNTFREKSPHYLSPRITKPQNDISAFTGMQFKVVRKGKYFRTKFFKTNIHVTYFNRNYPCRRTTTNSCP